MRACLLRGRLPVWLFAAGLTTAIRGPPNTATEAARHACMQPLRVFISAEPASVQCVPVSALSSPPRAAAHVCTAIPHHIPLCHRRLPARCPASECYTSVRLASPRATERVPWPHTRPCLARAQPCRHWSYAGAQERLHHARFPQYP